MVEAPEVVTDVLGQQMGEVLFSGVVFVVSFAVIYGVGNYVIKKLVESFLDRRGVERHLRKPLMKITKYGVVFVSLAAAFAFAGFGNVLTSLATIAAAATLAVGFALQNVIQNFVAGVFIYIDKPFKIGHWIEWDDYSGEVVDISLRVTRVQTFDNELLTVPNSLLTENVVKNPVHNNKLRVKADFGIGYDDDIQRATEIIIEEAEEHPEILDDPAPSVRVQELEDSYIGLQSRIWIGDPKRGDYIKTRSEYVESVKEAFDAEGIEIPYPQRTLTGEIRMAELEEDDESTEERGAEDEERGEGSRGESDRGETEGENGGGDGDDASDSDTDEAGEGGDA